MIYKNGELILEVQKDIINGERFQQKIGAIYKGNQLVWLTIYNAVRSCYGAGTWYQDKLWSKDDKWRNN